MIPRNKSQPEVEVLPVPTPPAKASIGVQVTNQAERFECEIEDYIGEDADDEEDVPTES